MNDAGERLDRLYRAAKAGRQGQPVLVHEEILEDYKEVRDALVRARQIEETAKQVISSVDDWRSDLGKLAMGDCDYSILGDPAIDNLRHALHEVEDE